MPKQSGSARGQIGRSRRTHRLLETLEDRTLLSFTQIPQPDSAYTGGTTNLAGSIPADHTTLTSLSDGTETITFSETMTAGTVPTTWATWNSPPNTESATPRVLSGDAGTSPVSLTLSIPANEFGFEMEPDFPGTFTLEAKFLEGATVVGTVSQSVSGKGGALLFAGKTDQAFTSVQIIQPSGTFGFAIAQPRYALAEADLGVTKASSAAQVNPGGSLAYTLSVVNNGPNDAVSASLSDPLPAGTTFASVVTPSGWTANTPAVGSPGTVTFTNPLVTNGATASFTINVNVSSSVAPGTMLNNTATISSTTNDPSSGNNSSTAATTVVSPFVVVNGNSLDNQFLIQVDPTNSAYIDFTTDGSVYKQLQSTIKTISVYGLEGNDTLTVDNTSGAIAFPINFDGGPGANKLVIKGGTATSDTYAPGAAVGAGTSTMVIGGTTERIQFQNLSPVLDTVPGPLTVVGTPSNDTINYSASSTAGNGLVVVNNFESIEFNSKSVLTLDGRAGDDTITVNNTSTPTGLTTLKVVGGIGNDTLLVDANKQPVLSSDITSSAVNIPGATPIAVNYDSTIENVKVINATAAIAGSVSAIKGAEGVALTNVPVATFNFTDPTSPTVSGKASDFSATTDWGDGTKTPGVVVANSGGGFSVLGSHTYFAAGSFSVVTTVTDLGSTRAFTPTGGVPVLIQDLASAPVTLAPASGTTNATIATSPLVATGVAVSGFDGLPVGTLPPAAPPVDVLVATFMDTGTIDTTGAAYSASIRWGDGTAATPATRITHTGTLNGIVFSVFGTHTYLSTGAYPVVTTITKTEGTAPNTVTSVAIASSTATIVDAPLSFPVQTPISTTEASIYPIPQFAPPVFSGTVATFTDANTVSSTAGDFKASIDWGDGTPATAGTVAAGASAGTYIVSGAHTYADSGVNGGSGTFHIQVFVTDIGGTSLTVPNTAAVADKPIVLTGVLNPSSDSGLFNNDAITNVTQPNFYGTSEPFSHVVLFANGTPIGRGQADNSGAWSVTSNLLADGSYKITATATDQFGVTTAAPVTITPNMVIDTVGPRITFAAFDRMTATVSYTFQDSLADGTPGGSGLLTQSLMDAANYSLNRLHARPAGTFIVTSISLLPGATPQSEDVTVVFNNGRALKGGFFQIIARAKSTLLVSGIQDVAGNALDGEFYGQQSASGNGVPGGDFVANVIDLHHGTPPHGNSGPLTIIGYPHPGSQPPASAPIVPVSPSPTRAVTVKRPAQLHSSAPPRLTFRHGIRLGLLQHASGARRTH
jgi:uncharacterized repeat protein (TIGR01451 family)